MLKESIGHTLLSISPLGTKVMGWTSRKGSIKGVHMTSFTVHQSLSYIGTNGKDGQAGLKPVLKESIGHPLLSISHLETKGRDGQAGLKAVLMESIGHILLSISPRGTKLMSWTSRIGSMKRVRRTSFTVH